MKIIYNKDRGYVEVENDIASSVWKIDISEYKDLIVDNHNFHIFDRKGNFYCPIIAFNKDGVYELDFKTPTVGKVFFQLNK